MFDNGLLLLTASALRAASVSTLLRKCSEVVKNNLYIHLINSVECLRSPRTVPYSRNVLMFVNEFYSRSTNECSFSDLTFVVSNITNNDNKILANYSLNKNYQVVLTDVEEEFNESLKNYLRIYFPESHIKLNESFPILPIHQLISEEGKIQNSLNKADETLLPQYDNVCLGGTFDRLHAGHKILLTQACLMATEKLIVGVTHGEMNRDKILHELMETTDERMSRVSDFLRDIKQNLEYQVVPLVDPFGPSIEDPTISAIAVSEETTKGATSINVQRQQKGFEPLQIEEIKLIYKDDKSIDVGDKMKISSTSIRKELLGTLLRKPKIKSLNNRPYLIGLTGGIASGKTSISKRLETLGAGIINCDFQGHQTYEPGTKTFENVVSAFGSEIVDGSGKIDRAELGKIVFKDKEKLSILNNIVWPAIRKLVKLEVEGFAKQGKNVVVIDAAVLLEAGWDSHVHEVWTTIIPAIEAETRILNRNKHLTRDQAVERIQSQMSNEDRVKRSNVVLCTLWDYDVTQGQVDKAWKLLLQRLP